MPPIIPGVGIFNDVKNLFQNEEFADIVLAVENREFNVHRIILIARSPVFAAMFRHKSMKENLQNRVEINDLNEEVVEAMLQYIYTDQVENLEELASGLLAAAEKYGIQGLKDLSQDALGEQLSVENSVDMLILADRYGAHKLKSTTIDYIVAKSTEVLKIPAWGNMANYSKLLMEILSAMSFELHGIY